MKPNQWCEISTLISQHRKPIIPGATATGPMTDAITKLKLPPSCLLQTTFGPQKPTWKQTKYKLPLDHRANMDTGQVQITFGPEEPTRVQVKSYHLWATKSNQRIKTDIGPQLEQNLMNSVISMHGLNTSERHRRPSRKLGRTRRQHVTTVQASIV